jgi:1,4-dihydroxy-2-naphthoate octaprenyltransferase
VSVQAVAGVARAPFLALPVTLIAVGAAVAVLQGGFSAGRAFWAMVGLVALHVAVNAFNEASDFRTGIDFSTQRTPFSGGSGTLPEGRLSHRAALAVATTGSVVGLAVGVGFLPLVGWKLLPIMMLGAISVLAYTDLLARLWVGELFAGLGLGLLPVAGTVLVQTGSIDATAVAASLPAFFMTFNLLLLNEFPDETADREGGRRNLVLLLGRKRAAWVYVGAALLVPISLVISVLVSLLPVTSLLAIAPSLLLISPFRWALGRPSEAVPHAALGANVVWILTTNLVLAGALLL